MKKILLSVIAVFLMAWFGVAFAGYEINVVTGKLDKTGGSVTVQDFDPSNYGGVNWGDSGLLTPFTWGFNSGATQPQIEYGNGTIKFRNAAVTIYGTSSQFCWANGICLNGDTARKLKLESTGGTNNEDVIIDNDTTANEIAFTSTTGANLWNLGAFGIKSTATTNAFGNVSIGTFGTPASTVSAAGNVSIGTAYAVAHAAPSNGVVIQGNVGIGTWLPTTPLEVVGTVRATAFESQSTSAGANDFYEASANGNNKIRITAPSSLSADTTYTLPSADGTAGYVLKTDGGGGLSWVANGAGGGATPGGGNNAVQYNVGGSLTGDETKFSFNGGNVGIGTSNATSGSLSIVKNGSTNLLALNSVAGAGGDYMVMDSNGKIGIGTTNTSFGGLQVMNGNVGIGTWKPGNILNVVGTIQVGNTGSNPTTITSSGIVNASSGTILSANSGTTTVTGNGFNSTAGVATGSLYSCTGNSLTSGNCFAGSTNNASFTGNLISSTFSGAGTGRAGLFQNTSGSNTGETVRISNSGTGPALVVSAGNVGIGTAVPAKKFTVKSGDVYVDNSSAALIMKSPDGTCSSCGVDNSDVWACASITCP